MRTLITVVTLNMLINASAFAGAGWYVTFINNTNDTVTVEPAGDSCWYRNDLGSSFTIPPGTRVTKYTEEKSSGSCAFQKSIIGVDIVRPGSRIHVEMKGRQGDFGSGIVYQEACADTWTLTPIHVGHVGSTDPRIKIQCWGSGRTHPGFLKQRVTPWGGGGGSGIHTHVWIQELGSVPTEQNFTLVNKTSGKCIDLANGDGSDGATIQQWDCDSNPNMHWGLSYAGDNYYYLVNKRTGKCLDLANGDPANGARIQQWSCVDNPNMQWRFQEVFTGWYRIINRRTGKCVDLSNGDSSNGARIQQWDCGGNPNMQWREGQ